MTKAELRRLYVAARSAYASDECAETTEYANALDTMLCNYFGMPLADLVPEDGF